MLNLIREYVQQLTVSFSISLREKKKKKTFVIAEKCKFLHSSVSFLIIFISVGSIQMGQEKMEAVLEWIQLKHNGNTMVSGVC